MNVKLTSTLSMAALFFLSGNAFAQKKDSTKVTNIDEVVVMGYTTKKSSDVTGNAVQLTTEKINTPSAITIDQTLQGQAAGVVVNASSGTPGSVQSIRIRGIGSINASNAPLFVVDGVPIMNDNLNADNDVSSSLSPLSTLNNEDIESMTVLKDAAATAAYGARGSNGVIVITTKKGKKGKTSFQLDTNVGFQSDAFMKRHPLTGAQKLELLGEALYNDGYADSATEGIDVAKTYNLGGVGEWDGKEYNWEDIIRRKNAMMYTTNLSAAGGDEKSDFYASLGYNKTEGTVITRNPFERITGKFNYNRKLTDRLKLQSNFTGSWITQNPILEGGSYYSNPYLIKILMNPWVSPYNSDGSINIGDNWNTSLANILYVTQNNIYRNTIVRGIANVKLDYELAKRLTYSTRVSLDYMDVDNKTYANRYNGDGSSINGYGERTLQKNYNFVIQNSLNYWFTLEQHRFDFTAIHEFQKNQYDYIYAFGQNYSTDGLTNIASAADNYQASTQYADWKNVSYLGMFNYNFDNRLNIDATIRREGSSKFAKDHRFGTFWSTGIAYNLNRDILSDVFNDLKLRASYGLTGNSGIDVNKYQTTLSYDSNYGGNGAAYPSVLGNDDLTWEKNKTFDVGLTFALLNNRISGSFAYYHKKTYDLLQSVPVSLTNGYTAQVINVGSLLNKGYEASLSFDIIKTEDFTWTLSGNIATVKNEVLNLAKDSNGDYIDPNAGSSYKTTEIGRQLAYWNMPTWAGVDPETGSPLWYVDGKSGETTSSYSQAGRSYQGTSIPKYSGGITTNFSYKNWFLNATLYFAGGHKIYDYYTQFYMRTNAFTLVNYSGDQELLDRWQNPGDITDVPKLSYENNDYFYMPSTRFLYDGTFARLKDLSLGYNIDKPFLREIGINGLTLSVRGTNLFTWVKDKDLRLDPETQVSGYTSLTTPPTKSFIFGVNIKF
ncbi:SusC/RagA family TonB-linked outer membrane protein [Daejeonia sp. YH14]|uniref:SusC/RagA family TonB-linked outer membrane protein n=1 Tax=Daejeonia sp. YH14 TaxID=3439042 RepID=UPI003F499E18